MPAHTDNFQTGSFAVDSAEVLLENELNLHDYVAEKFNVQIEKALALLYGLAIDSESPA